MGVRRQDHVDALDARSELAVDIEAVMRQQHNQLRAVLADFLDIDAQIVLADAERPVRNHPARIGDRGVREGLADDSDLDPAALEHLVGFERRLVPFSVAGILAKEREAELVDDLFHPVGAERELPMTHHGVRLQQRHAVDHVLALGLQRGVAVLPGVAAIEQQGAVATFGADRFDDGGDAIEPAELSVGLGQCRKVGIGEGVGVRAAGSDAVIIEQCFSGDVRYQPLHFSGAEVDRRLAKIDRAELGMDVGDVHQRDISEWLEPQQVGLRQPLLGERGRPASRDDCSRRRRKLNEIAPGNHARLFGTRSSPGEPDPGLRAGGAPNR